MKLNFRNLLDLAKEKEKNAQLQKEVDELKKQLQSYKDKELTLNEVKEYSAWEYAIGEMLMEDVIFTNTDKNNNLILLVNINDIFAWACADCEQIEYGEEILDLYSLWKQYDYYGIVIWASYKRKMLPQDPIVNDMKKNGIWDNSMEKLEPNYYWSQINKSCKIKD